LVSERQELFNIKLQKKYKEIEENEVRYERIQCDDAEYLFVAFGSSARICQKAIQLGRQKGLKVGLLRPITVWPYPYQAIRDTLSHVKGILVVEMNAGQMIEDVQLAVAEKVPVKHYGRFGGMIPTPDEVLHAMEETIIKK